MISINAILFIYPNASRDDFALQDDSSGAGVFISFWNKAKLGPQPTDEQLNAPDVLAAVAQAEADKQAAAKRDAAKARALETLLNAIADGHADPVKAAVDAVAADAANLSK